MKKLLNAISLISGTAIGAGLTALPLVVVNVGSLVSTIILLLMAFIAYQSSAMVIELNGKRNTTNSIMELSRLISGNKAFLITAFSFYILSFSLLTVYLSSVVSTFSAFLNLNTTTTTIVSGIILLTILSLNIKLFANLNSCFVLLLLGLISIVIFKLNPFHSHYKYLPLTHAFEILSFVPIAFTSYGVQNMCHHVCDYLENDKKKIKLAFFIGILIPTLFYILWIFCVFQTIQTIQPSFLLKLQQHQVEVGELIQFLCQSSQSMYIEIFLKLLTLFAIVTSALGIAIGLKAPVKSILKASSLSNLFICIVPSIFTILIPNAFINILSFGGMIATIFVLFIPYYLSWKTHNLKIYYHLCFIAGIFIVLCEWYGKI